MKALTLTEPYASLVAMRHKAVETRSWSTEYRGLLAIHAAKGYPKWAKETAEEFAETLAYETGSWDAALTLGRILCVVELVDVKHTEVARRGLSAKELKFGDYHEGRFAWFFRYSHPIIGRPLVRGALSLWEWNPAVAQ